MYRLPLTLTPSQTPLWIKIASTQKQDGEIGVGDTIERIIKTTGLDSVAKGYEKVTGKSCGCSDRKKWLNTKYPYHL